MTTSSIDPSWRELAAPFCVRFDAPAGAAPAQGTTAGMSYLLAASGPITIGAWTGGPWSLEHWRALVSSGGGLLGPSTPATVCGQPAVRQEAVMPRAQATGLVQSADDAIGHVTEDQPARTRIAVGFDLAGAPVVIEWAVAQDQRAAWRAAEDRFFASVRCAPAAGG